MTRDQIRNKIADIIMENIQVNDDSGLWGWYEAADEIMKLWDQGFTYKTKNTEVGP